MNHLACVAREHMLVVAKVSGLVLLPLLLELPSGGAGESRLAAGSRSLARSGASLVSAKIGLSRRVFVCSLFVRAAAGFCSLASLEAGRPKQTTGRTDSATRAGAANKLCSVRSSVADDDTSDKFNLRALQSMWPG